MYLYSKWLLSSFYKCNNVVILLICVSTFKWKQRQHFLDFDPRGILQDEVSTQPENTFSRRGVSIPINSALDNKEHTESGFLKQHNSKTLKHIRRQLSIAIRQRWLSLLLLGLGACLLIFLLTGPINVHPVLHFHTNVPKGYRTNLRRTSELLEILQTRQTKDDKEYLPNLISVYKNNFANHTKGCCTVLRACLMGIFYCQLTIKRKYFKGVFLLCKLKRYLDVLKPSFREPTETSNLTYIHVHKCGGTSIIELYEHLYATGKIPYLYAPHDVVEEFYTITPSKQKYLYYTFVRDPISRMISSYFEIHRRGIGLDFGQGLTGLGNLLLDMYTRKHKHNEFPWRINHHVWPQMLFLVDKIGNPLPIDYIGRMESMEVTLPYLLEHFTKGNNATQIIEYLATNQFRSRTKDSNYINEIMAKPVLQTDTAITIDRLTAQIILLICDLYWIDFYCLDLELPQRHQTECQKIIDTNLQKYGEQFNDFSN
ncbi:hypothetical protein RFI_14376 [Reticulomyxa filosa]|uniref:Uncharacterized protein n=1 Tax=Reticulomyxa filosa TaxID=46433 RepID=X6NBX1_RETFI|nr:hypothetical protein RFI_14376 [Reticulomyxa filosa]|eukprot:ETO22822.1 hypothetical protein RFI_14376 [Reticulomyxa filosa]